MKPIALGLVVEYAFGYHQNQVISLCNFVFIFCVPLWYSYYFYLTKLDFAYSFGKNILFSCNFKSSLGVLIAIRDRSGFKFDFTAKTKPYFSISFPLLEKVPDGGQRLRGYELPKSIMKQIKPFYLGKVELLKQKHHEYSQKQTITRYQYFCILPKKVSASILTSHTHNH